MASVGYDGSLRQWNLKNMQMETHFEDRNAQKEDSIIQCIAWCTIPITKDENYSNLIAMGTQGGLVKLVDLVRNRVVSTLNLNEA